MKFLVTNYSCLQNPWLGRLPPPDPCCLCPLSSTEFVETPPHRNISWVRHCCYQRIAVHCCLHLQGIKASRLSSCIFGAQLRVYLIWLYLYFILQTHTQHLKWANSSRKWFTDVLTDWLSFLCSSEKYFWPIIDKKIPNKAFGLLPIIVAIYWSHYDWNYHFVFMETQ